MKYVKNQIYETYYKSSTIPKGTMASLGTVEADACSHYGRHNQLDFWGQSILPDILKNLEFHTVLDIGAGEGRQKDYFTLNGKSVKTCDLKIEGGPHCDISKFSYDYNCNFLDAPIEEKFDFVFSSHVLEHQKNVGLFIDKLISCTKEQGYICTLVPIRKPFITGGHFTIWNGGLLLYNFVMAGIDCSESYLIQKDYEICLVVKNTKFDPKTLELKYDRGDIDKLQKYFPFELTEPFNGDIMYNNTLWRKHD